jgi:hypothetical protein
MLRRHDARWVYVDTDQFSGGRPHFRLEQLRANPMLEEQLVSGTVHVFRINLP